MYLCAPVLNDMKLLIFNGEPGKTSGRTSVKILEFLKSEAEMRGVQVEIVNIGEANLPFFDFSHQDVPLEVSKMVHQFRSSDLHIWITPLYHGSITGMMKNALDWLEVSSKDNPAYLTNKLVGLLCWADGGFALNGINAMEQIAKALRAWVLPYSIPATQRSLINEVGELQEEYKKKLKLMLELMMASPIIQKEKTF